VPASGSQHGPVNVDPPYRPSPRSTGTAAAAAAVARACNGALALLLPVWCAGCDAPDVVLCGRCRDVLIPRVRRRPLAAGLAVCSALPFEGVPARILRALKEDGRTALARPLGFALAAAVAAALPSGAGDIAVVPIPSSRRAFRRRGYDVTRLLVRRGGLQPFGALTTSGSALDQRGLGRAARADNVAGTMHARGVEGAEVIVVDDVVTTGATLREAVRALTAGGARVLGAATAAATARHAP